MMRRFFEQDWQEHKSVLEKVPLLFDDLCKSANIIIDALKNNKKILFWGNGGSASDSQHLAAELVGRYQRNRKAISAISITTDTSILTAIGNDFNFEEIFSRQIESLGRFGDIGIAFTTSGKSANVLRGLEEAKRIGLYTIAFTGEKGLIGNNAAVADIVISVPSTSTPRIQEIHIFLGHMLCSLIEQQVF